MLSCHTSFVIDLGVAVSVGVRLDLASLADCAQATNQLAPTSRPRFDASHLLLVDSCGSEEVRQENLTTHFDLRLALVQGRRGPPDPQWCAQ